jgi:hypothetical protein
MRAIRPVRPSPVIRVFALEVGARCPTPDHEPTHLVSGETSGSEPDCYPPLNRAQKRNPG